MGETLIDVEPFVVFASDLGATHRMLLGGEVHGKLCDRGRIGLDGAGGKVGCIKVTTPRSS